MNIILLVLFLISIIIGFAITGVLLFTYLQKKVRMILDQVFVSIFLFIIMVLMMAVYYVWINYPFFYISYLKALYYYIYILTIFFYIYFIQITLIRSLKNDPGKKIFIFPLTVAIIALAVYLLPYLLIFFKPLKTLVLRNELILQITEIIMFIYLSVLLWSIRAKITSFEWFITLTISISGIIIPGFLGEIYLNRTLFYNFYSNLTIPVLIYYLLYNLCLIFLIRKELRLKAEMILPIEIPENFFLKYEISSREKEIIFRIIRGQTSGIIAQELFISIKTVKNHIYNIYKKLHIKNRIGLINKIRE